MSLKIPSQVGDQFPASSESAANLHELDTLDLKTLRALRSNDLKNKVATRVVLEKLKEIHDLTPREYLGAIASWLKAGCVYVLGGAAGAGILGLATYGVSAAITNKQILPLTGLLTAHFAAAELGIDRPLTKLSLLYVLFVRDSANRAADWSTKQDQRNLEKRAEKTKELHKEICEELKVVYDDCAKKLRENANVDDVAKAIEYRQWVNDFALKISVVEKTLKQLQLTPSEIESILQRLKDAAYFAQTKTCELSLKDGAEKKNLETLAAYPEKQIKDVVIPYTIQERASFAHRSRIGYIENLKGYGFTLFSGAKAFCITALASTVLGGGYVLSQSGLDPAQISKQITWQNAEYVVIPSACVALLGMGRALIAHRQKLDANSKYVQEELKHCKEDLQKIYDGIAMYFESCSAKPQLRYELMRKLPSVREEIQKLHFPEDSVQILSRFNQTLVRA